jgi:hypothetical protein
MIHYFKYFTIIFSIFSAKHPTIIQKMNNQGQKN